MAPIAAGSQASRMPSPRRPLALFALALAAGGGILWFGTGERELARPAAPALELLQPDVPTGLAGACDACGWIESHREIRAYGAPLVNRYTVRMRDGSSRVFDESAAQWRLGERLIFID